jgi:single-strand DNA-binding protein
MLNQVALIGRLTKDPEYKEEPGVATFRLAVDRPGPKEEGKDNADYMDVEAWGKTGEFVRNNLVKGRLISVGGSVRTRSWKDQEGKTRSGFSIRALTIDALDKKPGTAAAAAPPAEEAAAAAVGGGDFDQKFLDNHDPFADD